MHLKRSNATIVSANEFCNDFSLNNEARVRVPYIVSYGQVIAIADPKSVARDSRPPDSRPPDSRPADYRSPDSRPPNSRTRDRASRYEIRCKSSVDLQTLDPQTLDPQTLDPQSVLYQIRNP